MKRFRKLVSLSALLAIAVLAVPASASAEALWARLSSLQVTDNQNYRQVIVRVKGEKTCGDNPGNASLYWRDSLTPVSYEDGVRLLTAALLSGTGVILDVVDTGSSCRVERILVAAP